MQTLSRLLLWIALVTLLRLAYLLLSHRPANLDEAQYWLWSQHLSWGYHSKPPLIAYAIALSTHWFGDGLFGLRFWPTICYSLISITLFHVTRRLYTLRAAWWVGLSFLLLPSVSFSATIISTDPFLMLFWILAFYYFVIALESNQVWPWLLMGLCIGLGIMSKYTALVFLLSAFLYLVTSKSHRHFLYSWHCYLALLVALLVVSPNLYWNYQHGFETLHQVMHHNVHIQGFTLHFTKLGQFWLNQLFVFSVIFLPTLLLFLIRRKKWIATASKRLLLWFCLPLLCLISVEALLSRAYPNWAVAAYLTAIIVCVVYLLECHKLKWLRINLGFSVLLLVVFYVGGLLISNMDTTHMRSLRFYQQYTFLSDIEPGLKTFVAAHPHASYLFDDRKTWSTLTYLARLPIDRVYFWRSQQQGTFDVYTSMQGKRGKNFILITPFKSVSSDIQQHFSKTTLLQTLPEHSKNKPTNQLYIYQLEKFLPE